MNEEYLWDKTGSDPEIEDLEETLSVFRSGVRMPTFGAVSRRERHNVWIPVWMRVGFALAASSVLITFFYFGSADRSITTRKIPAPVAKTPLSRTERIETNGAAASARQTSHPGKRAAGSSPRMNIRAGRRFGKTYRPRAVKPAIRDASDIRSASDRRIASLTNEERYAYDQLMLALSITSSRLKMVQDKVNGPKTNAEYGKSNE